MGQGVRSINPRLWRIGRRGLLNLHIRRLHAMDKQHILDEISAPRPGMLATARAQGVFPGDRYQADRLVRQALGSVGRRTSRGRLLAE